MAKPHWLWGPAIAVVAAVLLAVAANLVAQRLGANVNWAVSLPTAAIVGGFIALSFMRPKNKKPEAEGFTVNQPKQ